METKEKEKWIGRVVGLMLLALATIFLLTNASAMYAGECEQLDLSGLESLDNVVYSIVGNESNLEGLNISLNRTYVNICPALNYKPDNFTLLFWDNSVKEVIKEVVVYSRGRSRTRYVYENITKYVEVEKIVYVNETLDCGGIIDEWAIWDSPIVEEIGFFKKIWNWIIGLFSRH